VRGNSPVPDHACVRTEWGLRLPTARHFISEHGHVSRSWSSTARANIGDSRARGVSCRPGMSWVRLPRPESHENAWRSGFTSTGLRWTLPSERMRTTRGVMPRPGRPSGSSRLDISTVEEVGLEHTARSDITFDPSGIPTPLSVIGCWCWSTTGDVESHSGVVLNPVPLSVIGHSDWSTRVAPKWFGATPQSDALISTRVFGNNTTWLSSVRTRTHSRANVFRWVYDPSRNTIRSEGNEDFTPAVRRIDEIWC